MKKIILIFSIIIIAFSTFAEKTLTITLEPCTVDTIYLASYYGDNFYINDTAIRKNGSVFTFHNISKKDIGLYRLIFSPKHFADIIINNENIVLKCNPQFPKESMDVIKSKENKLYYDFKREEFEIETSIQALNPAILKYPKQSSFYDTLIAKYSNLQYRKQFIIDSIAVNHEKTFAAKLIKIRQTPFIDVTQSPEKQLEELRDYFFYGVHFSDTSLLNSYAYTEKAMEYLSLYGNPNLTLEQLQIAMTYGVDKVLAVASENPIVFDFILEYLIAAFEQYHFDEVLAHISENWAENCSGENSKNRLKERLANYQNLTYGKSAPNFELITSDGTEYNLYNDNSEYTLIIFYATGCSHCHTLMQKLRKHLENQPVENLQIIAISIDENVNDWRNYIETEKSEWIDIHEEKIWDGEASSAYSIYATPTLFLLNNKKEIIAKPITFNSLKQRLKEFGMW